MSTSQTIVALGEFDDIVDIGLRQLLGQDRLLRLVDFNGDDQLTSYGRPSVVILDQARMQDLSRLTEVRSAHPHAAIILIAHRENHLQAQSRLMGVRYLSQRASTAEIVSEVRCAAEGKNPPQVAALTPRESEVMVYLVAGASHREIAAKLHIGVETVRTHSTRIRRKLGLRQKHELIGLPFPQQAQML